MQPPSMAPLVGSSSTAKSPASSSGEVSATRARPLKLAVDLLALVEEEGEVAARLGDLGGDAQHDADAALHVDGAAAPQLAVDAAGGQVGHDGQRHGVDVPGQHDALGAPERGARDDRVAVAGDLEVRERTQGGLDGVGEGRLVLADRLDVADGRGQRRDVGGQVEDGTASTPCSGRGGRVGGGAVDGIRGRLSAGDPGTCGSGRRPRRGSPFHGRTAAPYPCGHVGAQRMGSRTDDDHGRRAGARHVVPAAGAR